MKRLFLILALCVGFLGEVSAQKLSNSERRKINYRALQAVEQYESLLALNTADKRNEFIYLFDKQNVSIYNDLLGYPTSNNRIALEEYVKYLSKQRNVISKISNFTKLNVVKMADGWHIIVSFMKSMQYLDKNGILFSSTEYNKADHKIVMDLRYDASDDCCYIVSINGTINSMTPPLRDNFIVLDKTSDDVYKRLYGRTLLYNSYNQVFVQSLDDSDRNIDTHINHKVKCETDHYKYLKLDYSETHGRFKARFAMTPAKAFKVTSPVAFSKHKSMAMEAGVDFGGTFTLGKSSAMGIFVGAAFSQSSLSFELNDMKYSTIIGGVQASGSAPLSRDYVLSASEGIRYTDIAVPLYFGFEHCLAKNVLYLVWNVGVKAYFNLDTKIDQYRLVGTISQGSSTLAVDQEYKSFINPNRYSVPDMFSLPSISAMGSLGFNFNLYKRRLFANIQVGYEYGLAKIHTSDENALFDAEQNIHPLVPTGQKISNNEATRSFMDCISYRRQAIWLEAGLMVKF